MADAEIKSNIGIHNRWDIEVIDAKTKKVKQKAIGFNVITKRYWVALFDSNSSSGTSYYNPVWYIQYGSGTGTPSEDDTALFTYAGMKASGVSATDMRGSDYISRTYSIQLGISEANGVTISEVGFSSTSSASGNLTTHAVLKDMNGNPISIVKTEYDIINIYGTIYFHYDLTSDNGIFFPTNLYNMNYNSWVEADSTKNLFGGSYGRFENYDSTMRGFTGNALAFKEIIRNCGYDSRYGYIGGFAVSALRNLTSYTKNTAERKVTVSCKYDVGDLNAARGIGSLIFTSNSYGGNRGWGAVESGTICILSCSPALTNPWWPGSQIVGETIGTGDGTTKKFKAQFDFPFNATVKVNGVVKSSGVTVRKMPGVASNTSEFCNYLQAIDFYKSTTSRHYFKSLDLPDRQFGGRGGGITLPRNDGVVYYNPFYEEIGLSGVYVARYQKDDTAVEASNDLVNWYTVSAAGEHSSNYAYPWNQAYKNYKYFRCTPWAGNPFDDEPGNYTKIIAFDDSYDGYNIIFDEAPAVGDVITMDYTTPYIAKDSNHVLNLTLSIQFNEYNPD